MTTVDGTLVCYDCGDPLEGEELEAPAACSYPVPRGQNESMCGNFMCDICAAGVQIPSEEYGEPEGKKYGAFVCSEHFKEEWV